MGLLSQLLFKNRIEWRFWYKAGLAAFALFCATAFSFSGWGITLAFLILLVAFFSRRDSQEETLGALFWFFSLSAFVGLALLNFETSFFRFWDVLQFLPFLALFAIFLLLFSLTPPTSPHRRVLLPVFDACLIFVLAALTELEVLRIGPFSYIFFFVAVFAITKEGLSRLFHGYSLRIRADALIIALSAVELLFVLGFLPLGPLFEGALAAIFFIFFLDLVDAHGKGTISQSLIIQKVVIFVVFFIIFALAAKLVL